MTLRSILWRFGYTLQRCGSGFWDADKEFSALYVSVRSHTLVAEHRAYMLYQFANVARHLAGDVAQVGVYKGGMARMLAEVFKDSGKDFFLFDTFDGLPGQKEIFADASIEGVRAYLAGYRTTFKQGFFPDTASDINKNFAFVYLDADLEKSIADGLEFFYPKMTTGGFIVVDDYGSKYWPGVKTSVDAFARKINACPIISAWSQCVFVKT